MFLNKDEASQEMANYTQSIERIKTIISQNRIIDNRIENLTNEGFKIAYISDMECNVKGLIYDTTFNCGFIKIATKANSYCDFSREKPYAFLIKNEQLRKLKLKKILELRKIEMQNRL